MKRDTTAAGETIVTLRNVPPTTKTGDLTKHVKRVTERGSVGRIILYKKGALSADVAFRSLAEAEAAAASLSSCAAPVSALAFSAITYLSSSALTSFFATLSAAAKLPGGGTKRFTIFSSFHRFATPPLPPTDESQR